MDNTNIGFIGGGIELQKLMSDAKAGDGAASCKLGDLYREGRDLPYKPKEVFRWYARSALLGDPVGQNQLGACFEHGVGCRPNPRSAAEYYALSAAQGCSTGQMNLGLCYLTGRGVAQDGDKVREWIQQAADRHEPSAAAKLAELLPYTSRGGRWTESLWLRERSGEWDCIGAEVMQADEAEKRNTNRTAGFGPPTVEILTHQAEDCVVLTWADGPSAKIQLRQHGCEREHTKTSLG